MSIHTDFLDRATAPDAKPASELFLAPNRRAMGFQVQQLVDAAHERDLNPRVYTTDTRVGIGGRTAVFRVAFPGFAERHRGTEYYAIHGLEHVEDPKEVEIIRSRIRSHDL